MKINYLKWLFKKFCVFEKESLYVLVAVIFGLVVSHFYNAAGSPSDVTTSIIASLALLRTCKEEK